MLGISNQLKAYTIFNGKPMKCLVLKQTQRDDKFVSIYTEVCFCLFEIVLFNPINNSFLSLNKSETLTESSRNKGAFAVRRDLPVESGTVVGGYNRL